MTPEEKRTKIEELSIKADSIKQEKNVAIKNQKYEIAAKLRGEERELMSEIEALKS